MQDREPRIGGRLCVGFVHRSHDWNRIEDVHVHLCAAIEPAVVNSEENEVNPQLKCALIDGVLYWQNVVPFCWLHTLAK